MKGTLVKVVSLFALVLASTMFTTSTAAQGGDSRIQRGFELAPVELHMKGHMPRAATHSPARKRRSTRMATLPAERRSSRLLSSHGTSHPVPRMDGPRAGRSNNSSRSCTRGRTSRIVTR